MIRPIAIHLPQFHPIPENDLWWGEGFTEWTNVRKANPLFKGHYQPHIPSDLGYYDLREETARVAQAALAKKYGVYGFCYYHYWFNGKRLLNRPLDDMLKTQTPGFPFMICWANENWTRRWDGLDDEILMQQNHGTEDDEAHIRFLIEKFFSDERYIRINNKPVVIIYKSFLLPDAKATLQTWRRIALEYQMDLYICHMAFSYKKNNNDAGFDASIDFEPFGTRRPVDVFEKARMVIQRKQHSFLKKVLRKLGAENIIKYKKYYNTVDYDFYHKDLQPINKVGYKIYPSIVPGWDNTSRRQNNPTLILKNSTPAKFKTWLKKIVTDFKPYSDEENFIFINAWNEWAEGNHLEPCKRWGTAYLDAVKDVVVNASKL